MAVTFGFYNSVRGDRVYNAEQMSSIFSGIIQDGVFENFPEDGQHLVCSKGIGLTMIVGPGRAWFNDTWTNNDSPLSLTFDAPDNQNDRIDTIALEINKTNSPHTVNAGSSAYVVKGRSNKFVVVKGTPAADPVRAALIRANGIYQYPIAVVRISPSTPDEIKSYDNVVGVSSHTPFIIGAVQSVSSENVLNAWKNEVDQKIQNDLDTYLQDDGSKLYDKISDYFSHLERRVSSDIETNSRNMIESLTTSLSKYAKQRHIWVLDIMVDSRDGVVTTFTKSDQGGANIPHKFYPDFFNDGHIVDVFYPQVNDIVVGSNGCYGVVTYSEITGGTYEIRVKSTGNSLFAANLPPLVVEFHGIEERVDTQDSEADPYCTKTFQEVKNAYLSGRSLEFYLVFETQEHGDGGDYDVTRRVRVSPEYVLSDDELTSVNMRYIDAVVDSRDPRPSWAYSIGYSGYGIEWAAREARV